MGIKFQFVFYLSLLLLVLVVLHSLPTSHSRPRWLSHQDGVALVDNDDRAVVVSGSMGIENYRRHQVKNTPIRTLNDNGCGRGSHVMENGMVLKMKLEKKLHHFQGPVTNCGDNSDLIYFQQRYDKLADGSEEKAQLLSKITEMINYREHLDSSIDKIVSFLFGEGKGNSVHRAQGLPVVDDWGCLRSTIRTFETHCGSLTTYGMIYTGVFANVCNNGVASSAMEEASKEACRGFNLGKWDPAIRGYSVAAF